MPFGGTTQQHRQATQQRAHARKGGGAWSHNSALVGVVRHQAEAAARQRAQLEAALAEATGKLGGAHAELEVLKESAPGEACLLAESQGRVAELEGDLARALVEREAAEQGRE